MEKLSSILPASPRVKSVDLSEAKPRRPGAPSFGIREGSTAAARDRVTISGAGEAAVDTLTYRNPKDAKGAKIAEDITKKFFETRLLKNEVLKPRSEIMTEDLSAVADEIEVKTIPVEPLAASANSLKQTIE